MSYHYDNTPTEAVLFNQLNNRTKEYVKKINHKVTAQELIDQA
jgi:hypothetical protein